MGQSESNSRVCVSLEASILCICVDASSQGATYTHTLL